MERKISDENSCAWTSFVVLFFFVSFLFAPNNFYFFNFKHCVSIIKNFFVFKILNLLTLLKQEGAQWQEPIFVLIALCVNLLISGIFYSQKDREPQSFEN